MRHYPQGASTADHPASTHLANRLVWRCHTGGLRSLTFPVAGGITELKARGPAYQSPTRRTVRRNVMTV